MAARLHPNSSILPNLLSMMDNYYGGYVGLYAPWIIVPLAGAIALILHWLMQDGGSD